MNLSDIISITNPVRAHLERCIHSYSPRATCKQCVRYCPSGSIQFTNGRISIESCDGCGRCIQACPHDVFEMDFQTALEVKEGPLFISCKKEQLQDVPAMAAGCLQQFTWLQLALLVERFEEVYLYAEHARCEQCEFQWFPEGQIALMNKYGLEQYGEHVHIVRSREDFAKQLNHEFGEINNRRQFMKKQFSGMKHLAKNYTEQTLNATLASFNETLNHKEVVFEKAQSHTILLNELYEKGVSNPEEELPLQALVSSTCRFCHTCEKLCPWQASAIIEEDGHAVLAHHDVLCARCGLCIDICPEHGLMWSHGLTQGDIADPHWRVLNEGEAVECERCGELFYPTEEGQTRCAICRNKF